MKYENVDIKMSRYIIYDVYTLFYRSLFSDDVKRQHETRKKNSSFISIRCWLLVAGPFSPKKYNSNARVYIVDDVCLLYELNNIKLVSMTKKKNVFIFPVPYNILEHFIFS